ncbi:MAG: large subunit ribosomal protein L21 [Planctomycetota bacterium]|jgi:large subunit ribosomal protein L21
MYAVISDRQRQFTVREGDVILCDTMDSVESGQEISFDQVALVSNEGQVRLGKPLVEGASVKGEVLGLAKGPKLVVFKFRRRKDSRCKNGHRQKYTRVRITSIQA